MSAIIAGAFEDRIEIMTDGAVYEDDGTVIRLTEKVWRSDNLPLAFATRGSAHIGKVFSFFVEIAASTGSVDATIEAVAQGLADLKAKIEASGQKAKEVLDGVLAAVSETHGPVLFYFHTHDGEHDATVDGFTLNPVPEVTLGSAVPPRKFRDSGLPMYWAIDGFAKDGARFMNLMRRHPMPNLNRPEAGEVYGIGGHVDLTTVSADGAKTERLCTWPDRVGEKIEPERMLEAP